MDEKTKLNIEEQRRWNDLSFWIDEGHEWSEQFGGTEKMWNEFLYPKLKPFILDNNDVILEIAPGQGRITDYLLFIANKLIIVDMNEKLIEVCKNKFESFNNIEYHINDGLTLPFIPDNSLNFVISWDSFVHMHQTVVESYIKEISRTMKKGAVGFIHHSNLGGGNDLSFLNLCGRANNSPELFKEMCENNKLEIISQEYIKWNDVWDIISIFKK